MPAPADELHGLLFDVRRSARYHVRRRGFYERLHKIASALNILSGSTTFIGLIKSYPNLSLLGAGLVTIVSTVDLVIGSPQMARKHNDLARQFISLEKKIITVDKEKAEQKDIIKLTALRLTIEANEPPVYRVLDALCHNELCKALGYGENSFFKISGLQAALANWIDFFPGKMAPPSYER